MKTNSFYLIIFMSLLSTIVNAQWTQLGNNINGEAIGDYFGSSISINADGTIVAVGAIENDGNGSNAGHVRVYQYSSGNWTQIGNNIEGEAAGDYFGSSVSLNADGTILAIGAVENDGSANNAGHVRVYQYSSGNWIQIGNDIDGEAADDNFGYSVSLSSNGTKLAIGAIYNDGNANDAGHVRVYQYSSNNWTQIGNDIEGENSGNYFGHSVSLNSDGTVLAIGAPGNDNNGSASGHVRVYQDSSSHWVKIGNDINGEAPGDHSGSSVSLSSDGTILAIGAPENDDNGYDSGHIRVYQDSSGNWVQIGNDINGDAAEDYFGYSVSLSSNGTILAGGAPGNDALGSDAGLIRIYQYSSNNWTQIDNDIEGDTINETFGFSISLNSDGRIMATGSPENNAGVAKIYTNPNISIIYKTNNSLITQIYPNPTTGKFVVKSEEIIKKINVLNVSGETIYSYDNSIIKNNLVHVDMQGLCKGIYIVNINTTTGKNINKKIILQ